MSKGTGFRQRAIADYVSAVPGCTKADAMRAAGLDPRGFGVYAPNRSMGRAIARGLVIMEHDGPERRLFLNERDRQRWHLRRELLTPATPAERVAEIERLDAERAATWTD